MCSNGIEGWKKYMYVCVKVTQPCPTLWSHGLQPFRIFCQWNSPGKDTGVGFHSLLQGILLTQVSNPGLLHWQADPLPTEPPGEPFTRPELANQYMRTYYVIYTHTYIYIYIYIYRLYAYTYICMYAYYVINTHTYI